MYRSRRNNRNCTHTLHELLMVSQYTGKNQGRFSQITSQGMADGSASKPALIQDTGYMVEKNYLDIAPYLGAFGAYLMPQ